MRNTALRDRHRRLIRRGRPDCAVCNEPIDYEAQHLDPLSFQIDHITPLSKGGEDVLDNIQACHRKCNRDKSDTVPLENGATFITNRIW